MSDVDVYSSSMEEIREVIVSIMAEHVDHDAGDIEDDHHFNKDLGGDSLDSVEIMMELEEKLELQIPEEEATELTTVGKILDYIKNLRDNK